MTQSPRTVHNTESWAFPNWYPSSSAVSAGPFVFTASASAIDWENGLADAARTRPGLPYSSGHPVKLQVRETYRRLQDTLAQAGSSLAQSVSINQWQPTYHGDVERAERLRDPYTLFWEQWRSVAHPYIQSRDEFLLSDRPTSCLMPVDRLIGADELIEIQLVALRDAAGIEKKAYAHDIHSPLGGYSVGMEAGPWVFSAGFIATDFETGLHPNARVPEHIWYGNQVAAEIKEVLRQIRLTMEASDAAWSDVVKVVLYLTPLGIQNLPAVDEVWAQEWPVDPPARAVIPVSGIGGVRTGNVEIYVIASRPELGAPREVVHTGKALGPLGHSVQAIRSGPFLFLSTQLGRTADGPSASVTAARKNFPHTGRHITEQVRRIHDDVAEICSAAGTSIENTVKVDAFLSDFANLPAFLDAWKNPFTDGYPASGFFEAPPGSQEIPGLDLTVDLVVHIPQA